MFAAAKNKIRDIIAIDSESVYQARHLNEARLDGERQIRNQIQTPKDLTITLTQSSNGSYFNSQQMQGNQGKQWKNLFARRLVKTAQPDECQYCYCVPNNEQLSSRTVCTPCQARTPLY